MLRLRPDAAAVLLAVSPALAQPAEVTNLQASHSGGAIHLQWDAVPHAAGYFVHRALHVPGTPPEFTPILCTPDTEADDAANPAVGEVHLYATSAFDGSGNEGKLGSATGGGERTRTGYGTLEQCLPAGFVHRAVFAGAGLDPAHHDIRGFFAIYDDQGNLLRDVSDVGFPPGADLILEPRIIASANDGRVISLAGECTEAVDPEGDSLFDNVPDGWFFVYDQASNLIAYAGPAGAPGSFKTLLGLGAIYLPPATDTDAGGGLVAIGGAGTDPATRAHTGWLALYDDQGNLLRSHAGAPGAGNHEDGFPITPFEVYDVAAREARAAFAGQRALVAAPDGTEVPEGAFVVYDDAGAVVATEADLAGIFGFLPAARRVAIGGGLIGICGDGYPPGAGRREAWFVLMDLDGTVLANSLSTGVTLEKCDDVAAGGGLAAFGLTGVAIAGGLERPEGVFFVYDAAGNVIAASSGFKASTGLTLLPIVTDVDADGGRVIIGGAQAHPDAHVGTGFYVLYDSLGFILRHSGAPGIPPTDPGYIGYNVAYPPEIFSVDVDGLRAVVGGRNRRLVGNDCEGAGICPAAEGFFAVYDAFGGLVTWSGPYAAAQGFTHLPPVTDVDAEWTRAAVGGQHDDPASDLPTGFFALFGPDGSVVRDSMAPGMPLVLPPRILEVDIDGGLLAVGGVGRAILAPGGGFQAVPEGWFALYDVIGGGLLNWSGPYGAFYAAFVGPTKAVFPITVLPPVATVDASFGGGDGIQNQAWVDGQILDQLFVEARTVAQGGRFNNPPNAKGSFFVVYDEGGGLVVDGYQPQFLGLTLPSGGDHGVAISHNAVDTDRGYTVIGGARQKDLETGEAEGFFIVYDPYGRVVTHWLEYIAKRGITTLPQVLTVDVDDDRVLVGGFHDPTGFDPEGFFAVYDLRGNLIVDSAAPGLSPPGGAFPGIFIGDTDDGWSIVAGDYPVPGGEQAIFWAGYDRWGSLVADSSTYAVDHNNGDPVLATARDAEVEAYGTRIRLAVAGRGFIAAAPPGTPTVRSVMVLYHCSGDVLYQINQDGKYAVDVDLDERAAVFALDAQTVLPDLSTVYHPDYRLLNDCGVECATAAGVPALATYYSLQTNDADTDDRRAVLGGGGTYRYFVPGDPPIQIDNFVGYYAMYDVSGVAFDPPVCTLSLASPAPAPLVFPPLVARVDTEEELTVLCGEQGYGQLPSLAATYRGRFWGLYGPSPSEPPVVGSGITAPILAEEYDSLTVMACDLDDDRAIFAGLPDFDAAGVPTHFAPLYDYDGNLVGDLAPLLPVPPFPGLGWFLIGADVDDHAAAIWGFDVFLAARAEPVPLSGNFFVASDDEYALWRPFLADPLFPFLRPFSVEKVDADEVGDQHGHQPGYDEDE